ncbi:sulfur carrier protein ThiS [Vibrio brasiliensis]
MNTSNKVSVSSDSLDSTSSSTITIEINSIPQLVPFGCNLENIVTQFAITDSGYVFAINNQVVPRSVWSNTILVEGDSISLFQAIAGG